MFIFKILFYKLKEFLVRIKIMTLLQYPFIKPKRRVRVTLVVKLSNFCSLYMYGSLIKQNICHMIPLGRYLNRGIFQLKNFVIHFTCASLFKKKIKIINIVLLINQTHNVNHFIYLKKN